jgi:hypothetical protein
MNASDIERVQLPETETLVPVDTRGSRGSAQPTSRYLIGVFMSVAISVAVSTRE